MHVRVRHPTFRLFGGDLRQYPALIFSFAEEVISMKPVRCKSCSHPIELVWRSEVEERYRCTMCGKQLTVEIAVKPSKSEDTDYKEPESPN